MKLPCLPVHPLVTIQLYKWAQVNTITSRTNDVLTMQDHLPPGIKFNPRTGFIIEEPLVTEHNGTYLCVFTDSGTGHKVNKLEIHLLVKEKEEENNQLEVWCVLYIFIVII